MDFDLKEMMALTKDKRLLFVEDDENLVSNAERLLGRLFATMSVARNGQEGLELFKKSEVDLIISDIQMPVMDGLEMIEKIREIDLKVPIVIMSAHNESSFLEKSAELGVFEHLIKPVGFEEFITTFKKLFG